MIPKILHYIWLGNKDKLNGSKILQACRRSWETHLSGWEINFYNEESPEYKEILDSPFGAKFSVIDRELGLIKKYIPQKESCGFFANRTKADLLRLYLVSKYGGVYADADIEFLRPVPDYMLQNSFFAFVEKYSYDNNEHAGAEKEKPAEIYFASANMFGASRDSVLMRLVTDEITGTGDYEWCSWVRSMGSPTLDQWILDILCKHGAAYEDKDQELRHGGRLYGSRYAEWRDGFRPKEYEDNASLFKNNPSLIFRHHTKENYAKEFSNG